MCKSSHGCTNPRRLNISTCSPLSKLYVYSNRGVSVPCAWAILSTAPVITSTSIGRPISTSIKRDILCPPPDDFIFAIDTDMIWSKG